MAAGLDPARIYASVPSNPGDLPLRAVRDHLLRDLPGLWLAADRDGGLLYHRVGMVPFLPLSLCAARRPVHDALAQAEGLLRKDRHSPHMAR